MKKIFGFLSSTSGRTAKFMLGALIVSAGLFTSPTLVVIGLLPLSAAFFDVSPDAVFAGLKSSVSWRSRKF
jgi:hypothetical protein